MVNVQRNEPQSVPSVTSFADLALAAEERHPRRPPPPPQAVAGVKVNAYRFSLAAAVVVIVS